MSMQEVKVDVKGAPYTIYLGSQILGKVAEELERLNPSSALIVTNVTVGPLYLSTVKQACDTVIRTEAIELPDGEQYKNWSSIELILSKLASMGADRHSVVIALGGGVVGDMAGFASAIYMRGIRFIQVPTTLLAQVDSSVGGKTGVNLPAGKNMIGAFHQPSAVIADSSVLKTLPAREVSAGIGEIIKHGMLASLDYFEDLELHMDELMALDQETVSRIVAGSCMIKADVVSRDTKEKGERAHLNLGHTFGHAIEKLCGYGTWLHGEAVGCGLVLAARSSQKIGNLSSNDVERVINLVSRANLPVRIEGLSLSASVEAMKHDKKNKNGEIQFVLMRHLGGAYVDRLPYSVLESVLEQEGFKKDY